MSDAYRSVVGGRLRLTPAALAGVRGGGVASSVSRTSSSGSNANSFDSSKVGKRRDVRRAEREARRRVAQLVAAGANSTDEGDLLEEVVIRAHEHTRIRRRQEAQSVLLEQGQGQNLQAKNGRESDAMDGSAVVVVGNELAVVEQVAEQRLHSSESDKEEHSVSEDEGPVLTAAERAQHKLEERRVREIARKLAAQSHKEKVAKYNEHLGKLSESHDIPKVGPG